MLEQVIQIVAIENQRCALEELDKAVSAGEGARNRTQGFNEAKDLAITASLLVPDPGSCSSAACDCTRSPPTATRPRPWGYEYFLSKRTWIYTDIASAQTDGTLANGTPRKRTSGVGLGIPHSF
jgi:hypothetical protein